MVPFPQGRAQIVVERPGELIPRCFWLLTSMTSGEMSGEDLRALYRKRGKAEGHLGELMSVIAPALSSRSRRKSHYRGKEIRKRENGVDAFACNEVGLLLAGFGYQIMHVQRDLLERVTGTGWSLRPLAERVIRTPARFTVSGRRITITTGSASAHARPRTRDPAQTLRIARPAPKRRTLSRPGRPQGSRGVFRRRQSARSGRDTAPFRLGTPVLGPETGPTDPRGLREVHHLPILPSTRHFMNKAGLHERYSHGRSSQRRWRP